MDRRASAHSLILFSFHSARYKDSPVFEFQEFCSKICFDPVKLIKTEILVERDHGPPAEGAASFHTTRWTIVMRAAQSRAQGRRSALAEFLTAEEIFDARWAMAVLAEALRRLRQEYAAAGETSMQPEKAPV